MEISNAGLSQLNSIITNDVQPFVVKGITQGIQESDLERELAEEVFGKIMTALNLDVPNPFRRLTYRVEVALNSYDTLIVVDEWESDTDLTEDEVFDELEFDIPSEIQFVLSLKDHTARGEISLDLEDQIRDAITIDITENE